MRFAKIAIGFVLLHGVINFLLFFVAYGCAMSAFGEGTLVPIGRMVAVFLAVINFPVFWYRAQLNGDAQGYWTHTPLLVLTPWPSALQFVWSVLFGCVIALIWTSLVKQNDT